jgi:hypothetical protein
MIGSLSFCLLVLAAEPAFLPSPDRIAARKQAEIELKATPRDVNVILKPRLRSQNEH